MRISLRRRRRLLQLRQAALLPVSGPSPSPPPILKPGGYNRLHPDGRKGREACRSKAVLRHGHRAPSAALSAACRSDSAPLSSPSSRVAHAQVRGKGALDRLLHRPLQAAAAPSHRTSPNIIELCRKGLYSPGPARSSPRKTPCRSSPARSARTAVMGKCTAQLL